MRLHVVGFPHTCFDAFKYSACAFTGRSVRMVRAFTMAGYETDVYWGGESTPEYIHEFISIISNNEMLGYFGEFSADNLPVVNFDATLEYWKVFHERVIKEVKKRLQPGDLILLVGGSISQELIAEFGADYSILEPGVGYEGIIQSGSFACFESYAWLHHRYGRYSWLNDDFNNIRFFDAVIPHPLDPDDFCIGNDYGYIAFIGRLIARKGPHLARDIAKRANRELLLAGGGVAVNNPGFIQATDGTIVQGNHVRHIGSLNPIERKEFLSHAHCLIVPTIYTGPFETVHAEALLSGVPVVAPDHGVFTETVDEAFRYRTVKEAVEAVGRCSDVDKQALRESAINRFSIAACAVKYDNWFRRLATLRDGTGGFYA